MLIGLIIFAILFSFSILGFLLYLLTRSNVWNSKMLESDEHVLYTEENVGLKVKSGAFIAKDLNCILTEKRIFLLRGKYRYITVYLDKNTFDQKFKKSMSTQKYHIFLEKASVQFGGDTISFSAKSYIGQSEIYELHVKNLFSFEEKLKNIL